MKKIISITLLLLVLSSCNNKQEPKEEIDIKPTEETSELTSEEIDLIESLLQEVEGE